MSQNNQPIHQSSDTPADDVLSPGSSSAAAAGRSEPGHSQETGGSDATAPEAESTVGTGTGMALGCIAGTVVLIIFGLIYLAISSLI